MADMRMPVNPADVAIHEQQRQQRLAQGRALEVQAEAEKNRAPAEFAEPFMFRFRKIKNGSFSGLWELAAMRANGKVDEIITDADTLPNVLDLIGNIFANKGY